MDNYFRERFWSAMASEARHRFFPKRGNLSQTPRKAPSPLRSAGALHIILLFKTGAAFGAGLRVHLAVVGAYCGHRPIAPAMPQIADLLAGGGKNTFRFDGDIHFFRPKMFADIRVHNQAVS